PLRPEADAAPPKAQSAAQKDCEPTNPDREAKPLSFDERSIPEGNRLAEQGKAKLRTAQSAEVTKVTREDMVTQAVDDFITAARCPLHGRSDLQPRRCLRDHRPAAMHDQPLDPAAADARPRRQARRCGSASRQAPRPQAGPRSRLCRDAQGRAVPRTDSEDVR